MDGERIDHLRVECINPIDYTHVGWLSATGATITEGYYTDTRIQGTARVLDAEDFTPLSMVRLIHEADFRGGEHYRSVLGTFFAMRSSDSWKSGAHETELELKSVLYGMSKDPAPYEMTLAKGSFAKDAFNDICNHCNRKRLSDGANNKKFGKNETLELGDTRLSWLHQLANLSGNRLDCDEMGLVTLTKYLSPSGRAPSMKLPYNSPLVLASGISRDSDFMEVPMRAIVTWEHSYDASIPDGVYKSDYTDSDGVFHAKGSKKYKKKTEKKRIIDWADVSTGNQAHINRRGFRVATWHAEDDLGDSKATAQAMAKAYIEQESIPSVKWSIETRWFEVNEGDVIEWKPSDEEPYRKVLVTDVDKDLFTYRISLVLKEV